MSVLSWTFAVTDRMSSPAAAMASGLDKVQKAAGEAKKGVETLEKGVQQTGSTMHESGGKVSAFFETLQKFFFLKEAIGTLGEVLSKAKEFGDHIVEEMRFKQASVIALEAMTGTRDNAIGIFEQVENFAARTGIAMRSVMDETRSLMAAGYSSDQIVILRQMLADLRVIGPREYSGMTEALRTIGLMGGLGPQANRVLKTAGLDVQEFNRQLRAVKGDTLLALVNTFSKKYDPNNEGIGAIGIKMAKTLPGAIDRIKQIPGNIMDALSGFDAGAGGGVFTRALTNFADAFVPGSEVGERIIGRIKALVDNVAEVLGLGGKGGGGFIDELAGPNGAQKVEQIFAKITDGVRDAIPTIRAAAGLVKETVGALAWIYEHTVGGKLGDKMYKLLKPNENPDFDLSSKTAWGTLNDPNSSWLARQSAKKMLGLSDNWTPSVAPGGISEPSSTAWRLPPLPGPVNQSRAPVNMTYSPSVTVQIDGNATREDGEQIAEQVKDTLSPMMSDWERLALQGGSG